MKRTRLRGIILPLAISMMFAMLILALALVQQQQSNTTFTFINEVESNENDTGEVGFSTVQHVLQSQATGAPDIAVGSTMMSGGQVVAFPGPLLAFHAPTPEAPNPNGTPAISVDLAGSFNGGTAADESQALPATGPANFNPTAGTIPSRYTRMVVTSELPNQTTQSGLFLAPSTKYFSVFSANFRYGVMSTAGSINIAQAFAVSDGSGAVPIGLPVNLHAHGSITVSAYLNGTAASESSGAGAVNLPDGAGVGGGLALSGQPALTGLPVLSGGLIVPIPSDFDAQLVPVQNQINQIGGFAGPPAISVSSLFNLESDLAATAVQAIDGGKLLLNSSIFSFPGGIPTLGGDFQATPGTTTLFPSNLNVVGNLFVPPDSVLIVFGSVNVTGDIVLGEQSTLSSTGNVQAQAIDLEGPAAPAALLHDLTTTVMATANITIRRGMQHVVVNGFSASNLASSFGSNITTIFAGFPPVLQNITDVNLASSALGTAQADVSGLQGLVGSLSITPDGVPPAPGVFMQARTGSIVLSDNTQPDLRASGLLVANAVQFGTNAFTFVGMAWAQGDITGPETNFLVDPYYCSLSAHTPTGDVPINAFRYTRTAYGKLP